MNLESVFLIIVLAPLAAALVAGLGMRFIPRAVAHWVTILGVGLSFLLSAWVLWGMLDGSVGDTNVTLYQWGVSDGVSFQVGFLVDRLTALMMAVVTFVSLMVHVYTVGYMHDDPGYKRFFSYISLFTFSMLMLVMANNFLQLFFGWEAVGLVSYLLIGFWYTRPSAIYANLKAFLVNRVGDFGFLLGIALVLSYTGSLDYATVFSKAPQLSGQTMALLPASWGIAAWSVPTVICILLFVGAMGKSAQVPLHVWLPDSMEGPTPISALIHAATMVTAGIFMVARMSPLFELSDTALSVVLVAGATTAFFMGLVGVVHNDIKRVVAYSTLSQLGYMAVALGASAYSAGMFHLMTHAFFKALLFLAAGSVIIAMHHEQDMRYMGGLRKYMPITYVTCVIGSLALIAFPGFSGFFSKDTIIEAVHASNRAGAGYAYWCVLLGAFVTGLYTFRMLFMTFHGKERFVVEQGHGGHGHDDHHEHKPGHLAHAPHESPWVVTVPLILLAIPSVFIGWFTAWPVLFGGYFGDAIKVAPQNDVLAHMAGDFQSSGHAVLMSVMSPTLYLALAGAATAWFLYLQRPELPAKIARAIRPLYVLVSNKFYFDELYVLVFSKGTRALGRLLWQGGDAMIIDGLLVNGSAKSVGWFAGILRRGQSGYLYHYAFAMIIGLCVLLGWLILK